MFIEMRQRIVRKEMSFKNPQIIDTTKELLSIMSRNLTGSY